MSDELNRTINGRSVIRLVVRSFGRSVGWSIGRSLDRSVSRSEVLWWLFVRSFCQSIVWSFGLAVHLAGLPVGRSEVGRSITRSVDLSVVCSVGGFYGFSIGRSFGDQSVVHFRPKDSGQPYASEWTKWSVVRISVVRSFDRSFVGLSVVWSAGRSVVRSKDGRSLSRLGGRSIIRSVGRSIDHLLDRSFSRSVVDCLGSRSFV